MSCYKSEVNKYLRRIKAGDRSRQSVNELYNQTYSHLKRIAEYYLTDRDNVEDVLSEVYEAAIEYINDFDENDEKSDGYNWLCKITQRKAYKYNEQEKRYKEEALNLEPLQEDIDIERIIDRADLKEALNRLDNEDRRIIYLYYYKAYTQEQIGETVKLTRNEINYRLKKIIKDLRKYLDK